MGSDPAFLFYPGDYLKDIQCLSALAQVSYDAIMCAHMKNICITQSQFNFITKNLNDDEKESINALLTKDENGNYYIEWIAQSIKKRRSYSESRRKNRSNHMKNICESYDEHMVNANENEIEKEISVENETEKKELAPTEKKQRPLWQQKTEEGYAEYLRMSEPHFDALLSDWKWIAVQKEFYPGCSVKRTLFRMWEQFWGTKAGWKNKRDAARGKPDYDPNWKQTIELNFKKSICYYGRDEVDDEKQQIDIKKRMGEL